jgi:hypothetical protein
MVAGPATFMAGDIERGDVKIVRLAQPSLPRAAGIIYRKDNPGLEEAWSFLAALEASAGRIERLLAN